MRAANFEAAGNDHQVDVVDGTAFVCELVVKLAMLGPQVGFARRLTFHRPHKLVLVRVHHRKGDEGNFPMRRADDGP